METVTNIGGLLGLYIGLSILDLSDIAKTMLAKVVTFLESIISVLFLRIFIIKSKKVIKKILLNLRMLKKLPLRYIINLITTPILFIQLFYLVYEYLQYPTQFSTEFVSLEKNSSNLNSRLIPSKEFPDITLCHRIYIEDAFFNTSTNIELTETLKIIDDVNVSLIEYDEGMILFKKYIRILGIRNIYDFFVEGLILMMMKQKWHRIIFIYYMKEISYIFKSVLEKEHQKEYYALAIELMLKYIVANSRDEHRMRMEPITDIDKYGLNGTFDILRLFNTHQHIATKVNSQWVYLKPTHLSLMRYGICKTLSPGQQLTDQYIDRLTNSHLFPSILFHYTMIFHPYGTIPVPHLNFFQFEKEQDKMILMKKFTFDKLPSPYDTNCQPYEQGNQHQCLNDCYTKKYLDRFKCVPSRPKHISVDINQTDWRFCPKDYHDDIIMMENNIKGLFFHI